MSGKTLAHSARPSPRILAALVLAAAGCFHHPNIDVDKLECGSNEECPVGYVCTKDPKSTTMELGRCVRPDAQGANSGTSDAEAPAPIDGRLGIDGMAGIDGVTSPLDSGAGSDSSSDMPTPVADAPSDNVALPPMDGSADRNANPNLDTPAKDVPSADLPMPQTDGPATEAPISGTGGVTGTGGQGGTGGGSDSGGDAASGGSTSTGGTIGIGGSTGSGGTTAGTGGTASTGGSSMPASVDCTDTSTYSNVVTGQYGTTTITVDNDSSKSYYMQANWWGSPYSNQTEAVQGLGFTITNPNNTSHLDQSKQFHWAFRRSSSAPTAPRRPRAATCPRRFPASRASRPSSRPTSDTMGTSSYNATYDVWFTASSAVVTGSHPGSGGAYLMVWLFKPTDKQPRGTVVANGAIVSGVKGGWDVWYDTAPTPPCVSYVSSSKISSLEFDLNNFIQDAIQSKYGASPAAST